MGDEKKKEEEKERARIIKAGKKFMPVVECQEHVRRLTLLFETLLEKHVSDKGEVNNLLEELGVEGKKVAAEVNEFFLQDIVREFAKIEVEQKRVDHLSRVIVHQFSDKFPDIEDKELNQKVNKGDVDGYIPRTIVPHFLEAFKGIFGSEYIEERETECNEYVKKYFQPWCMRVDWRGVLNDPDIIEIVKEILYEFKSVLTEKENYKRWFIREIAKSESFFSSQNEAKTEREFKLLTNALFRIITP